MVIIKMIATALSGDRIVTDKVLKFVTIKGVKEVTSFVSFVEEEPASFPLPKANSWFYNFPSFWIFSSIPE